MIANLAAWVAGAWWLQQQALLPALSGAAVLAPLIAAWGVLTRHGSPATGPGARVVAIAAFGLAGFFWAAAVAQWRLADTLPEIWEGRDVELSGVVAEMTQPGERSTRVLLDIDAVFTPGAQLPPRVALNWYRSGLSDQPPRAGQRWRLSARLRHPHGNANPHGFDFEAWTLERGIRAVGYVREQPAPRMLAPLVRRPLYLIERGREAVRERLGHALGAREYAGVIVALAIGDQRAIAPAQWKIFTRTGVNHLMSISGLHITMVASLVFVVVLRLWRKSAALTLRLPAVRAATAFGLLAALTYAAAAGFAVPAQRTVFMLAVVAAALWLGWMARPAAVLAAAAALVILIDPMAVIAPGFWLSFGAVAVIMLAGSGRIAPAGWLGAWARAQWAVTLALVPLLLALFQQVSLVSPLANAVAIPLVSLVVVPLTLLAMAVPLDGIVHLAHGVMGLCMQFLVALSGLPGVAWQQHAPPLWSVPLALAGALWMLLPRGFPARWAGATLMLPLFFWMPPRPQTGELWMDVLDVGQGLAVLVRTRDHALLYDAGPAFSGQIDAGDRIVVPHLRASGIGRLDAMIISHDDLDHSGGALAVLNALVVDRVRSSLPDGHPVTVTGSHNRACVAGESWEWDGVVFEMLHPGAESYNDPKVPDNDRSCVLRIASGFGSALLAGDIEHRAEGALVHANAGRLSADLLVVPHHGSRTSSTPAFVGAVNPKLAVFTVGYLNRFGHPHPAVIGRYRQQGSRVLRTDLSGALLVRMTGSGIAVRQWREIGRRYWQDRQG